MARRQSSAPSPSAFIDEARIFVKAGDGGNGIVSFRREKFVPLGGPDGGDGGRGGDVLLRGSRSINTLLGFQHRIHHRADRGGNGGGAKKHGKRGANLIIDVPLGTVVSSAEGFLADITLRARRSPSARGGKGWPWQCPLRHPREPGSRRKNRRSSGKRLGARPADCDRDRPAQFRRRPRDRVRVYAWRVGARDASHRRLHAAQYD